MVIRRFVATRCLYIQVLTYTFFYKLSFLSVELCEDALMTGMVAGAAGFARKFSEFRICRKWFVFYGQTVGDMNKTHNANMIENIFVQLCTGSSVTTGTSHFPQRWIIPIAAF